MGRTAPFDALPSHATPFAPERLVGTMGAEAVAAFVLRAIPVQGGSVSRTKRSSQENQID